MSDDDDDDDNDDDYLWASSHYSPKAKLLEQQQDSLDLNKEIK